MLLCDFQGRDTTVEAASALFPGAPLLGVLGLPCWEEVRLHEEAKHGCSVDS